jgi:outer membrane immunogenic protein
MAGVEARIGMVHGQWLPYATVGWGWAHVVRSAFNATTLPIPDVDSHWHSGWTAGAGLQYAINAKWSIGGEYRYFSGGTQTYGLGFAGGTKVSLNIQTVRFTVNMKF